MNPLGVVAVMAAHWESASEEGWITRQVAGALACESEVHVVTPDGPSSGTSVDGAFTLHRLGAPIDPVAETRRGLLVEGLARSGHPATPHPATPLSDQLTTLIDRDLLGPWEAAADVLRALQPDLVVIAGHQNVGARSAAQQGAPDVPLTLVALGSDPHSVAFPRFGPMFASADSVLAVTEMERKSIVDHHGGEAKTTRIGAPMAANLSSLTEPNTWVGSTDYILVVTGTKSDSNHEESELSRLIRLSFPDNPVGVCHTDGFFVWHQGRLNRGWPVERSGDMARLMAWARVTVDLHPSPLFARRCVESLLYGTPIVVPERTRAQEHAQLGKGGLWFNDPAELTWCIEALLEPATRNAFSAQGRSYAEAEYGSTDRFIDRVVETGRNAIESRGNARQIPTVVVTDRS